MGNKHWGTLYLANKKGADEFSEADELTIGMYCHRAAIAVATAHLFERERRRTALFASMSSGTANLFDVGGTLRKLVEIVVPPLGNHAVMHVVEVGEGAEADRSPTSLEVREKCQALPEALRNSLWEDGTVRRFSSAPAGLEICGAGPTMLVPIGNREFAARAELMLDNARLREVNAALSVRRRIE